MKFNQRKMGSLLSYFSIIINAIIMIAYTPIMIKYLGDAEYGVYNLSYSVTSYLGLLSLGFGGAYVRYFYIYKNKNDQEGVNKLNGLFLIVFSIISIVSIVFGFVLIDNINNILSGNLTVEEINLSANLMKIMIFNIAITFPDSVFNSFITANENFVFQKIISIIRALLNPFIGLPLLLLGYRSIGISIAITLATLISFIANLFYAKNKLQMRFNFKNIDIKLLKSIAAFSSFIFLGMLIDQINWQVDKIILGKIVGSISIAIYSIGALINNLYIQFSTSISSVFIPKINGIITSNEQNREESLLSLFTKIGRIQFYVLMLIVVGFIAVGKYFITKVWLDDTYINAYYIALILILTITVPLIQNIGIEIQKALNKHRFRSFIYFLIALINVLISIPLSKKYGEIGAAIGTGITTFIGNGIIMNWYYYKHIKLDVIYFWKEILAVSKGVFLPVVFAIIISKRSINSFMEMILYGLAIVVIYILSVVVISFNKYEKDLVISPIRKFFNIGGDNEDK